MSRTRNDRRRQRPQEDTRARVRRQANYIRLLEFLVAAAILSAGVYQDIYPQLHMLWVAVLLGYPLVAQALAYYLEREGQRQQETSRILVQLDAILIGVTIAALHYALIPALALLTMVHANAVTSGGVRPWLLSILLTVLGAGAGAALFGTEWIDPEDTPLWLELLAMLGVATYVGASSFYANQQTRAARMAQEKVIQQQRQATELSRKLAKYLPPQIWGSLFSGKRDAKLGTRRKRLTVFFSDIKGFTEVSEDLPLDTLTRMLNTYLNEMTRIALRHGGTIDKFIGDAVMVFFGDPVSKGSKQDAYNCVAMAIEMQRHMKLLRQRWEKEGIREKLEIRIGINTGYVTVGNFGAESRMDYTILGTDVNLASRLESACAPGRILISEPTWELVRERILCRNKGEIEVKGFSHPVRVFEVQDFRGAHAGSAHFTSLRTEGFGLHMDLRRVRALDKKQILLNLARNATALRNGETVDTSFETEGFALHVDSTRVRDRERTRIIEVMGEAAGKVKKKVVT